MRSIVLAALLLVSANHVARGEEPPAPLDCFGNASYGVWSVACRSESPEEVTCLASVTNNNSLATMYLHRTSRQQIIPDAHIEVVSNDLKLTPGSSYPLTILHNPSGPLSLNAVATEQNEVRGNISISDMLFLAVYGKGPDNIMVSLSGRTFTYPFWQVDFATAFRRILRCFPVRS